MFSDAYFKRTRLDYVLVFPDLIGNLSIPNNPFYEFWFDDVFQHAKELMITNKYILAIKTLEEHKRSYIDELIDTYYKEALSDLISAVCDSGEYVCDEYGNVNTLDSHIDSQTYQQRLDYINTHELHVKYNMFHIALNIFMSMFYQIYLFKLECTRRGIKFANLSYTKREIDGCYIVTCHVNEEVIKNYDESWYDRISLLYPV